MSQRHAVTKAFATQYKRTDKAGKGRILDELCATTGWHRNHASRGLRWALKPRSVRPRAPRSPTYGTEVVAALRLHWRCWVPRREAAGPGVGGSDLIGAWPLQASSRSGRPPVGDPTPPGSEEMGSTRMHVNAAGTRKHGDDRVEMIRVLELVRDSAVKSETQATNQVTAVLVTAPSELREALADLPRIALFGGVPHYVPVSSPLAIAKHALRLLARRALALRAGAYPLFALNPADGQAELLRSPCDWQLYYVVAPEAGL